MRRPLSGGPTRRLSRSIQPASGPEALEAFEDRVLYHLVDLAGTDMPLPINAMVPESAITDRLGSELARASTADPRSLILEGLMELERRGFADLHKVMGPWSARPTRAGRDQVRRWRGQWQRTRDRSIQVAVLSALDSNRRAKPERHTIESQLDMESLEEELQVSRQEVLATLHLLRQRGEIDESPIDQRALADGWVHITSDGVAALQRANGEARPRETNETERAWNEVARLKKRLALIGQEPAALIHDPELAQRCGDLLGADEHYDRVIREASAVLEHRVRARTGLTPDGAVPLMQQAFSVNNPLIRLSDHGGEQKGGMEIFAGVMGLFRNGVGHRLVNTITQDRALQFVVMVDLLLALVEDSGEGSPSGPVDPAHP